MLPSLPGIFIYSSIPTSNPCPIISFFAYLIFTFSRDNSGKMSTLPGTLKLLPTFSLSYPFLQDPHNAFFIDNTCSAAFIYISDIFQGFQAP
jgi:hypothetical protein